MRKAMPMRKPLLLIGNRTYSTWSLRAWLGAAAFGFDFDVERVPLFRPDTAERLAGLSPHGKLPVLIDGPTTVWDSLAILEYVADVRPPGTCWPTDPRERAVARAVSAEMHAGFAALRSECPMNNRVAYRGFAPSDAVRADVARVATLWRTCRTEHGTEGPWLFGDFSIADVLYAPVALRLWTYDIPLTGIEREYQLALLRRPELREWVRAAHAEEEVIAFNETPFAALERAPLTLP